MGRKILISLKLEKNALFNKLTTQYRKQRKKSGDFQNHAMNYKVKSIKKVGCVERTSQEDITIIQSDSKIWMNQFHFPIDSFCKKF